MNYGEWRRRRLSPPPDGVDTWDVMTLAVGAMRLLFYFVFAFLPVAVAVIGGIWPESLEEGGFINVAFTWCMSLFIEPAHALGRGQDLADQPLRWIYWLLVAPIITVLYTTAKALARHFRERQGSGAVARRRRRSRTTE